MNASVRKGISKDDSGALEKRVHGKLENGTLGVDPSVGSREIAVLSQS